MTLGPFLLQIQVLVETICMEQNNKYNKTLTNATIVSGPID